MKHDLKKLNLTQKILIYIYIIIFQVKSVKKTGEHKSYKNMIFTAKMAECNSTIFLVILEIPTAVHNYLRKASLER